MNRICFLLLVILLASCSNSSDDEKQVTEPYMVLNPESVTFNYKGGEKRVEIEANTSWVINSTLPDWLMITKITNNSIYIEAKTNEDKDNRSIVLEFKTEDKNYYSLSVHQTAQERLLFNEIDSLIVDASENQYKIDVSRNVSYNISILDEGKEWIDVSSASINFPNSTITTDSGNSNTLNIKVTENGDTTTRHARIVIYNNAYELSDTLHVIQKGKEGVIIGRKYNDGEFLQLQEGLKGSVDLVIMGEAFTAKDLNEGGKYEQSIRQAMEYYFTIEPFKSFREYFNVYMVVAESPTEQIGSKEGLGLSAQNNKFSVAYGSGTEIVCDDELVFEYAQKVEGLNPDKPSYIIVVLNDSKYAGTTYLYSNGNSIALCPMSQEPSPNDFEGVIHHEAGGHGFGFLCDEYVYHQEEIPEDSKKNIQEWQKLGFQMNVDFTNDSKAVHWKDLIGLPQYSQVGLYEGGYMYQYGIWRSESNSCMNNNIPYFNAQSRWCITKRIMDISGVDFTIEDFIRIDKVETPSTRAMSPTYSPPLGAPKWILK